MVFFVYNGYWGGELQMNDENRTTEVTRREPNYSKDIKLDVKNEYIYADHPTGISVHAMRLLRIAIAQCQKGDDQLYEYAFNIPDLAEMIGCDKHNLYRVADEVTDQMMRVLLKVGEMKPGSKAKKRHVFDTCDYEDGTVVMKLHRDMEDLLLNLGRRFTKIPIEPILMMKSKYGIRMYELICQKLMGHYPYAAVATEIQITLEEIRIVTGTKDNKTYDIVSNLKRKILIPAITDIEKCADWKIVIKDLKRGRRITGFSLEVWRRGGWEAMEKCKKEGRLPQTEELPGQMSIFDFDV